MVSSRCVQEGLSSRSWCYEVIRDLTQIEPAVGYTTASSSYLTLEYPRYPSMTYVDALKTANFVGLPDDLSEDEAYAFYHKIVQGHHTKLLRPNKSGATWSLVGKSPMRDVLHYGVMWGNVDTHKYTLNSRRTPVLQMPPPERRMTTQWWALCKKIVGDEVDPFRQIRLIHHFVSSDTLTPAERTNYRQSMTFYWCHHLATQEVPFVYLRCSNTDPLGTVIPFSFNTDLLSQ